MRVNIFGIIVVALGLVCIFLGVTGRYQVFVGGGSSSTSNSSSSNSTTNPPAGTKVVTGNIAAD